MTTENQAAVLAESTETATPAEEVGAETADEAELGLAEPSETPEGESQDDEGEDKVQAEIEKATRKAQRRIERLVSDKSALATKAAQLEAELAKARSDKEDGKKPEEDPREIARQIREVERTSEILDQVMVAGKAIPNFEASVAELVGEIGPQIIDGQPSELLKAVFGAKPAVAAAVLKHLSEEPEVAIELSRLTAAQVGRRIALIEVELAAKAKPKTSAAPKPLSPVRAAAAVTVDENKLTDAQWAAMRKKARLAG